MGEVLTAVPDIVDELLGGLPGSSLDEVNAESALLTRTDRKYLVPVGELASFLADRLGRFGVLDLGDRRTSAYESVYFDTDELVSYHLAARRRPARFKVRTRSYLDDRRSRLEVKVRSRRGQNVKHQHPIVFHDRAALTADGRRALRDHDLVRPYVDDLRPVLRTTYRRATLLPVGEQVRVTVDLGLAALDLVRGGRLDLPTHAVVETKTSGRACSVDLELWRYGHRPMKVSKFGTSLAALRPELPANVWHRTLAVGFTA